MLRRLGVTFDVKRVPYKKIDLKESQVNGARIGKPLVDELISDYTQGMTNGDSFPRPIMYPDKSGMVVLSGNQRCAAVGGLIAKGEVVDGVTVEAYVLDECDKLLREIIARSANTVHGGRSEHNERLQHAVYCVRALGMSSQDAAKAFVVSATSITQNVRAEKERDQLMRAGVDASRLPVTTLDAISKLPFDTNAKHQIATLTAQHDVSADRVKQIVNSMKKTKTQAARTAQVREFEKELSSEARSKAKPSANGSTRAPSRPRRDKVLRSLETLVAFMEKGNDGDSFTTLEELQFSGGSDNDRLKILVGRLGLRWKVLGV